MIVAFQITKKNSESNDVLYSIQKFRCFETTHLQLTFQIKWNITLRNNLKWNNTTLGWNGIPHMGITWKRRRDR